MTTSLDNIWCPVLGIPTQERGQQIGASPVESHYDEQGADGH